MVNFFLTIARLVKVLVSVLFLLILLIFSVTLLLNYHTVLTSNQHHDASQTYKQGIHSTSSEWREVQKEYALEQLGYKGSGKPYGYHLKESRDEHGLSRFDFASVILEITGQKISERQISRLENDGDRIPLSKNAQSLGKTFYELRGGWLDKNKNENGINKIWNKSQKKSQKGVRKNVQASQKEVQAPALLSIVPMDS